jgi:hypothetical protein
MYPDQVARQQKDRPTSDTNLPMFPALALKPGRPDQVFVVALIAYDESRLAGWRALPRRTLQTYLRRSTGSDVSAGLAGLFKKGWLERRIPGPPTWGREYKLGADISEDQRTAWVELGRLLFEPMGLVGDYLTRPAVKHGRIMLSGFLVLTLLERHGPVNRLALIKTLKPVMSRNTVIGRLERLEEIGLAVQVSDAPDLWMAVPDYLARLEAYEEITGLKEQAAWQDARIEMERTSERIRLAGGPEVKDREEEVLAGPCVFCGVAQATEVEHFPPKHWGGFNHPGLMFGACTRCNGDWGRWIRKKPKPQYPPTDARYTAHVYGESTDVIVWAKAWLDIAHWHYESDLKAGLTEVRAREWVEKAFPFWLAVFMDRYSLEIVKESPLPRHWPAVPSAPRKMVGRLYRRPDTAGE